MTFRSFVRPLAVALSLAFAAATAASPALAEGKGDKSAEVAKGKGKGKGKARNKGEHFPMEGEKFTKRVDARISKAKEKLSGALSKHGASDADKTRILKEFDAGAATVREAAKRVAKDGTVTKDEAKEVRGLVKSLRKQLKDKMPAKGKTV